MAHPIQTTQAQGSTTITRLSGSLTVVNAPDLRVGLLDAIKANKPKVLGINLAQVNFIAVSYTHLTLPTILLV